MVKFIKEMNKKVAVLTFLLLLTEKDAKALDCEAEVAGTREILRRKTSADRQVEVFSKAQRGGASRQEALRQVVEFLIDETARGVV